MRISSSRNWVGALTVAGSIVGALVGCSEEGSNAADTDSGTSGASDTEETTTAPSTSTSGGTGSMNCVPGQQDCECLNGSCSGVLNCVENVCVPGPQIDVDTEGFAALAGVRFPIEFDVIADEFSWSQVSGPAADLGDPTASPLILDIPPDGAGQTIDLRLTAIRNSVESTVDISISVIDATVEDAFAEVETPPPGLGMTEAVEFPGGDMWVASSTEGTLTQLGGDGTVLNTYDVGGTPVSLRDGEIPEGDNGIDVLYFADPSTQSVKAFVFGNQQVRTITDDVDGAPLGEVAFVVPRDGGDVVFSNGAGGQVFYYDGFSDSTLLLVDGTSIGPNPHALQFGPDGYLFIGTIGKVWKVPVLGDDVDPSTDPPEEITAGPAELYLDIGADTDVTLQIDGLAFDAALNLFAGASGASTLYLARYTPTGEAALTNSWTRGGNPLGKFIGIRHGGGDFSDRSIYFASGAEGRIGRVYTGVDDNL